MGQEHSRANGLPARRQVMITACGTGAGRRATLETALAAAAGTFDKLGCVCILDKNEGDLHERRLAIEEATVRANGNGRRDSRTQEFTPFIEWLPGVGPDFGHSVDLAVKQLPRYHSKVAEVAERTTNHMSNLGGAELGFIHLSSGGHLAPAMVLNYSLSRMLARPELLVGEIVRPNPTEEASRAIFWELMALLRENDYFGLDTILVTDNSSASQFRALENLDQFNAVATMGSLRKPTIVGEATALEMWQTLARRSRLTGIWAWKFPAPKVQVGRWPTKKWQTNREAIIDMGQKAVVRLLSDPSACMSGFEAKADQSSYFFLFGDVNEATLKTMSHLWQNEHSFMYGEADVHDVYIVRLAALDEADVDAQIEHHLGKVRNGGSLGKGMEVLASALDTTTSELISLWGR